MARFRVPLVSALLLVCLMTLPAQERKYKPYSLPPGKYERAVAYSHWQYAMRFLGAVWTAGTLVAILNLRLGPRLRNWAERASVERFVQAALFVSVLLLAVNLPRLPPEMFEHWLDRHYD